MHSDTSNRDVEWCERNSCEQRGLVSVRYRNAIMFCVCEMMLATNLRKERGKERGEEREWGGGEKWGERGALLSLKCCTQHDDCFFVVHTFRSKLSLFGFC